MSRFYNKLAAACMLLSCSSLSYADDAEIFFNKELQHVNPNVIFLLDTSGSMAFSTNPNATTSSGNNPNRLDDLKEALTEILKDKTITDIRVGIMSFASYLNYVQGLEEIDDINNDNNDKITVTINGSKTILTQKIINDTNGYSATSANDRMNLVYANPTGNTGLPTSGSGYIAFRFNNILLKQSTNASNLISKATLNFYTSNTKSGNPSIYMDTNVSPDYLTTTPGFLNQKIRGKTNNQDNSKKSSGTCTKVTVSSGVGQYSCDITALLQEQIAKPGWEDGNAINLYVASSSESIYLTTAKNDKNKIDLPSLVIELADNSLIANNKKTYRDQLIEKALSLKANGGTNTVIALQTISNYISGISKTTTKGPYHDTVSQLGQNLASPIEEGCQLTHIIMMTDGQPQSNWQGNIDRSYRYNTQAAQYMQGSNANYGSCYIYKMDDKSEVVIDKKETYSSSNPSEACGRSIASWMANVDQTKNVNGANFIRTHTIGFALADGSTATTFLSDVATYGQGTSEAAEDKASLVAAFKKIITDVRATDSPSASGRVTMSAQSSYKQRDEVFYALYASNAYNYWAGNMKRFKLAYIDLPLSDGKTIAQRPILVDKNGTQAMGTDGVIINTASSFWANSKEDGGSVDRGGVRGMLSVTSRPQFTFRSEKASETTIDTTNITTTDLGLTSSDAEARKKGLLEFIKGYDYKLGGGGAAPTNGNTPKIGDSARSAVTLATYGCRSDSTAKLQDCGTLNQAALLASNDGFIRGYDTDSGNVLYEYMPKEMLPLISKLQTAAVVNYDRSRFYGVDGNIVIYHNDANGNDYIDNGETAYAYAVAGRGGSYIYALDISNKSSPSLQWQITGGTGNFDRLGDTWSVPTIGKIKRNGVITPVLVFGGGYDKTPTQENTYPTRTSSKGNAVYIVDATNGTLIKAITEGLTYSVPSSIALVTDDSGLMTDIIFGDMGGQVWRFIVNNAGNTDTELSLSGGLVAKLGSGGSSSRRFFQKPAIYQYKDGTQEMISINIGSGFRNHPLSTDINDKFYSLRFPKASIGSKVLTESDLAVSTIAYTDDASTRVDQLEGELTNGFVINLKNDGEKVITDYLAEFGRLVFNTYVPVPTDKKTCKPRVGLQRTYVFDLLTGKSLLETAYLETNVSALPADVTYYCKGSYCTIVPSTDFLSTKDLEKGKNNGDSPFIVDISDKANPSNYIKTGSTDLFDLSTD